MLLNLEVYNGEMSPKFDMYVNTYTVSVTSDVEKLELDFKAQKDDKVNVIDNELDEGINFVYLEVQDDGKTNTYTLEVYKESIKTVTWQENYVEPVEVEKQMSPYAVPLIITGCFLVIFLTFIILFHRRKR